MKTIALPEDLHREFMELRLRKGNKNAAELIKELIFEYRQKRFLEASALFKQMLKKSGKSFDELLKDSRKIRGEIADEWFPD